MSLFSYCKKLTIDFLFVQLGIRESQEEIYRDAA
jgi:hypothetical protein